MFYIVSQNNSNHHDIHLSLVSFFSTELCFLFVAIFS